jgi:DNA-binding MarR family transcriptional regulator
MMTPWPVHDVTCSRDKGAAPQPRLDSASDLGYELLCLLRKVGKPALHQLSENTDIATYILLAHLNMLGPVRITALADAVHSDPSTVSRQTANLVRMGLLERQSDPEDGRASLLAVTAKGLEFFNERRERRDKLLVSMLDDWNEEDLGRFVTYLRRFNCDFETFRKTMDKNLDKNVEGELKA